MATSASRSPLLLSSVSVSLSRQPAARARGLPRARPSLRPGEGGRMCRVQAQRSASPRTADFVAMVGRRCAPSTFRECHVPPRARASALWRTSPRLGARCVRGGGRKSAGGQWAAPRPRGKRCSASRPCGRRDHRHVRRDRVQWRTESLSVGRAIRSCFTDAFRDHHLDAGTRWKRGSHLRRDQSSR